MDALERAESSAKAGPGGIQQFSVRVCVIECRDLKGKNKNSMSDPVCYVRCCGQSQHTTIEKKTLSPYWEQMFFFNLKITKDEFLDGKIQFQVYNANTFTRNELIGSFEFDMTRVYGEDDHELYRKWVGLYNADLGSELQGYLRCSIVVLGPGDVPANHEDDDDDEEVEGEDLQKMVLLPPQIERIGYELKVRAYRAEKLPKTDTFGKTDAYVLAQFASESMKTDYKKENFDPIWNTELRLPVYVPTMSDRIAVRVVDYDKVGDDEPIATMNFRWSSILTDHFGPAWVNLYGAYPISMRDRAQISKLVSMIARIKNGDMPTSCYKGRVLLTLLAEQTDEPKLGSDQIAPCEEPETAKYVLWADLFMATEVPVKTLDKVRVSVKMGHHELKSKKAEMEAGKVEYYQQFEEKEMEWPKDLAQVPDVIVDVESVSTIMGASRVGYIRLRVEDIAGFARQPEWHTIVPDKTSSVYTEGEVSGFLLMRLCFGLDQKNPDGTPTRPKRHEMLAPKKIPFQVRAHLYQAKELPAADATGTSDPFVLVTYGGRQAKTRVVQKSLYPVWYQTLCLNVSLPEDPLLAPPLIVSIYDHNSVSKNTLIGRVEVPFNQMTRHVANEPRWHELYVGDTDEKEGSLLASFQLLPIMEAAREPVPSIRPPMRPCVVEFQCIGLRGLVPKRLQSVNKPYIQINCGDYRTFKKTTPSAEPTATSPNILEVLHFKLDLPLNQLYAPTLNARVLDSGMTTRLLGTTSIPLAPYIPWTNDEKPQNNLPEKAESIPGAEEDPDLAAESVPELTPEEQRAKEEAERIKAERQRMFDLIPEDVKDANEKVGERLEMSTGEPVDEDESDSKAGGGVRTMPDVPDTKIHGSDPEAEKEKDTPKFQWELEFELKNPPFDEFPLWRGQKFGLSTFSRFFADKSRPMGTRTCVGKIKGNLSVFQAEDAQLVAKEVAQAALRKKYEPRPFVVRAYILRGRQMVPVSSSGKATPYLKLSNGTAKENIIIDKKNKKSKTLKPDFYKCYEIPATIPGNSELAIEVWDANLVGSDELMGRTTIDLETRLLSEEWRSWKEKPIEWRTLWSPASSFPQGKIEMWLEIMTPEEARLNPPKPIQAPSIEGWELRVVIWNTKDVVFKDIKSGSPLKKMAEMEAGIEDDSQLKKSQKKSFCQEMCSCSNDFMNQDKSDIFLTGKMELTKDQQETDVHWRSTNGIGNFNWRFVFPLTLPCHVPRLKLQIWDKNMLSANDSIAEAVLHLGGVFKAAYRTKQNQTIRKQWLVMTHPMYSGPQGQVEMSLDVVSEKYAKATPSGKGQNTPNQDPFLPPPERPETSFPPWAVHKMAKFTYRAYRKRIIFWGIVGIVAIVAVLFLILVLYLSLRR
ncbi:putative myoferlin-like protein [Monocercomonoides exilis]|uniref:putative myoferlin-like protein n=1 Tax=Monocercomonoides exilis TaxID=2049356 RepID=UPI0035593A6E|nr:putative myoferlin-like protein [Monocercomonoides exilis]|eukprot:MONOS_12341.1-p1 / transcript=MONOS_12341.1 / gene=MONOS_12341 / organism=Monocercomonoides_exilis_PA203 / gene_product=myoferlin-like protein / transcript_product=myoferlin-like protein / location=Mono_scaffold00678:10074-14763(-) / protein_length=1369 / sequence_SO=supercontig / SO=protein_coding / is_pseudo=false